MLLYSLTAQNSLSQCCHLLYSTLITEQEEGQYNNIYLQQNTTPQFRLTQHTVTQCYDTTK